MMTRLLALAIAATGLSVGGFQLGTRQAQTVTPTESTSVALPAGHALTLALQEDSTPVTAAEKVRLRSLVTEMEKAKKVEEATRVQALNVQISNLERKLVGGQAQRYLDLRLPKDQAKAKTMLATKQTKGNATTKPYSVRYRAVPNEATIVKLQNVERAKAQRVVEDRFEAIAIGTLTTNTAARVQAESLAKRVQEGERGFALLIALRERTGLNLTPKQVTQLQLLQADFLRRYAPLREESENGILLEVVGEATNGKKPVEVKFGGVKIDAVPAKTVNVVKTDRIEATNVQGVQFTPAKPIEFKAKSDVLYTVEVAATDRIVTGKPLTIEKATPTQVKGEMLFIVSLAHNFDDVEKRIQTLKDEIDDKVFEILNDDQGKRLRRMVALSLSPNP